MKTKTTRVVTPLAVAIYLVATLLISHLAEAEVAMLKWAFDYDDDDRPTKITNPAGQATRINYSVDKTGQLRKLVRSSEGGSTVTGEFDDLGRLGRMTDSAGRVAYGYDHHGRLNRVEREGASRITYTHDQMDRVTRIQVGDIYRIDYHYDFLGRLKEIQTPAGKVSWQYLPGQGEVIRSLPNGVKTIWKRQVNGELERITHGFFSKPNDKRYSLLAQYHYGHGPNGRITALREHSNKGELARQYHYDAMGRLTNATGPGIDDYRYEYDAVGNRTGALSSSQQKQRYTYDWAGRLTSIDDESVTYDANGNLTELTLDSVTRQFRYYPDGRLAEVRADDKTVEYGYDGFGRLISRNSAAGETRFIPDPLAPYWQPLVIEEPDGEQTIVIWDGPTPLALMRGGDVQWLLHDHLGSVRVVTDAEGGVARRSDYDPFGEPLDSAPFTTIAPGFAGLFRDKVAGGYLTLARTYVPELGSFLQPDPQKRVPLGSPHDLTLASYCASDPLNYIDRDGAAPEWYDGPMTGSPPAYIAPELGTITGGTIVSEVLNIAGNMPGAIGTVVQDLGIAHGAIGVQVEALQTVEYAKLHPGDPLGDLRMIKTGLSAAALATTGLVSAALGGGAMHLAFVDTIGSGIRSQVLQNRTMDLAYFGGAVLPPIDSVSENIGRHSGQFSARGIHDLWSVKGGFSLDGYNSGIFGRNRQSTLWTHATVKNLRTVRANQISGDFRRVELRNESGGHLFNLYEPQSTTITRISHDQYRLASSGGMIMTQGDNDSFTGHYSKLVGSAALGSSNFGGPGRGPGGGGPSPVGGVYLGGAGSAIEGLGALKGVSVDTNGNLVLIGAEEDNIKLPPLGLDDVVTVFRSVYLHGEGPTVSIDPNPEDPENSAMSIVHSEATKNTYVGWILYQADRLMKSYSQGVDNKTEQQVTTQVPGYADVLESIYFGSSNPLASQRTGNWERFWIVPAAARRFEGERRELTLFDVPLKAKTKKMKWVNGRLVDDPTGKSSPGALKFTSWFTEHYDGISAEQYLLPPPESGITEPVPVFTELRQIALMTAVAEKLRDQGVPMPFWMRDYEVKEVPFEHYTPGLEVTRSRQQGNAIRTSRIFGGVELSAQSNAVATYASTADASRANPAMQETIRRNVKLAVDLELEIAKTVPPLSSKPLQVHQLAGVNRPYRAALIPGAKTRALNPNRLEETDLFVPFGDGREIRLTRHFNSFFDPKDAWGRGWTMDLPRLQVLRVPVSRKGNEVSYRTAYELLTPLNSLYARFNEVRPVPEIAGSKLQVPDTPGPFYGLANAEPAFLKDVKTLVVLLKSGQEWHFNESGDFIASANGPQVTIYERDSAGRVPRIIGLLGGRVAAEIGLEYSEQGILVKATGTSRDDPQERSLDVSYTYGPSGRLASIRSQDGAIGYQYEDSLVTAITWTDNTKDAQPEILHTYQYNEQGQLESEKIGNDSVDHTVAGLAGGLKLSVAHSAVKESEIYTRYDNRMRPVETSTAAGSHITWIYQPDGSVESHMSAPNMPQVTVTESNDGRQRKITVEGSPTLIAQFNTGGKLTSLREGEQLLLSQHWRRDGQLTRAETKEQATSLQYSEHGLLSAVLMHPPGDEQTLTEWQQVQVDSRGAPTQITDSTGLDFQIGYDSSGAVNAALQVTQQGNMGYQLERDDQGRIRAVKSSWGDTAYDYGNDGQLRRVERHRGGQRAAITLADGRVRRVENFQGGVTTFDYHDSGELDGALRRVTGANGVVLAHRYDDNGRPAEVTVGEARRIRLEYDERDRVTGYVWQVPNTGAH